MSRLVASERAARLAGGSVARWWVDIGASAAAAITDQALDELFHTAMRTISETIGADSMAVLLANDAADELTARASVGLAEEDTVGLGIRKGEGMAGTVLATASPLIVADLSRIEVVSPVLRASGLRSVVAVPIFASDDHVLGVMYAGSRELGRFSDVDAEFLELVAERLGGALERVTRFESERSIRRRAERVSDRLARLQKITALLLTATTVDDVVTGLVSTVATGRSDRKDDTSRWCHVWIREGDRLWLKGVSDEAGKVSPGWVALDGRTHVAECARTKEPRIGTCGPPYSEELAWSQAASGPFSAGVLPILLRDTCLGVLVVGYPIGYEIDLEEQEFLKAMVEQAAQALDRAELTTRQAALARVSSFLADSAQVLAEASDYDDTLERLAGVALAALGEICLIDVIDDEGRIERKVARHRSPERQPLTDRLKSEFAPGPSVRHPALDVIGTRQTSWAAEMRDDFLRATTQSEEHFRVTKALEFRSYLAVPLITGDEVVGCLTIVSSGRAFAPDDVSFAERLALQVAAVVSKARRYDSTLRTSHILQQSLLPRDLPQVPGLAIETRYLPATRGLEVGGDFYDVILVPSGRVGFMIGDVAGHNRDAAASMGQLRSAARALAGQVRTPSELIGALQWSWELLGLDRIATALVGRLDQSSGEVVLASAGHHPPLLVGDGMARYLPVVPSTPLGAPSTESVDWSGVLRPGEVLLLYTDGVLDERRAGYTQGMERLARIAASGPAQPDAVCDRITCMLSEHRTDDVALLALGLSDCPSLAEGPNTP